LEAKIRSVLCGVTVIRENEVILTIIADYNNAKGIVFVVDSNDRERIGEAHDELHSLLATDELRDVALIIYANKQDLPDSMSLKELTDGLGLHKIRRHDWYVQGACATSGEGLEEGICSVNKR
jgi:ADP-ribosylation factor 1/2